MLNSARQLGIPMPMDEAVRRLKAEILSPDWRLTASRLGLLASALGSLRAALASRRDAVGVVTMAENVLHYIKRHQALDTYVLLAFLKEAMALAVSLYEEAAPDPHLDGHTFRTVYQRFQVIKRGLPGRVGSEGVVPPPGALPEADDLALDSGTPGGAGNQEELDDMRQVVAGLARDVLVLAERVEAQGVLLERLLTKIDRTVTG